MPEYKLYIDGEYIGKTDALDRIHAMCGVREDYDIEDRDDIIVDALRVGEQPEEEE